MKFKQIIIIVLFFFQQPIYAEEQPPLCDLKGTIDELFFADTNYVLIGRQAKAIDDQGKLHELPEQDKKIAEIALKAVHDIPFAECARIELKKDQNFVRVFFSTRRVNNGYITGGSFAIAVKIDLKTLQVVAQWYDSE